MRINRFFPYISHTAPHWPLHALEKDTAKCRGRYDEGYEPVRLARFERMKKLGVIDKDSELWEWHAWRIRIFPVPGDGG